MESPCIRRGFSMFLLDALERVGNAEGNKRRRSASTQMGRFDAAYGHVNVYVSVP
jgi:hypothetical protein